MHFQVSNFSFFGWQRKLHDNENFLNYGSWDYVNTHQILVPIQIEVPGCRATPYYYYCTYDYKYPTQIFEYK